MSTSVTTANTTTTTTTTTAQPLTKMLSLFRKPKSRVMANANTSETTLVSAAPASKPKRKTPRSYEPYQAEFSGMGLGGMPSLGGHMFLEPPPPDASRSNKKGGVKMVPAQPLLTSTQSSFASERVDTVKGRESFETFTTTVASTTTASDTTSYQRKLLKQHKSFFNNSFSNT